MGKGDDINIMFNGIGKVLHPGDLIKGEVMAAVQDEKKVKSIRVEILGEAKVDWSKRQGRDKRNFEGKQKFFDKWIVLYTTKASSDTTIKPGMNVYQFQYVLPAVLPSNFIGKYGYIRYLIRGVIEKTWTSSNTKTEREFVIAGTVNDNIEGSNEVNLMNDSIEAGMCCCKYGIISATIATDKKVYYPFEVMLVDVDIDNTSTRDIEEANLEFRMEAVYTTWYPKQSRHTDIKEYREISFGEILAGTKKEWKRIKIDIPDISPSLDEDICEVINIHYYVELNVIPKGISKKLIMPLEIKARALEVEEHKGTTVITSQDMLPSLPGAIVHVHAPR